MNWNIKEKVGVFRAKPDGFSPSVEVSACYIESNEKFLFLKRAESKPEGNRWGVPGGKIESFECSRKAVIREIKEETNIKLNENELKYIGKIFIRKPQVEYVYHMYHQKFDSFPEITLNEEHRNYVWQSLDEITHLPVMSAGIEALHHFKALRNQPDLIRKPFYFIRHGETDVNADPNIKRVDDDLPLNSKGRNQARLARKRVAGIPFESVCFSPIQRAVETKEILVSDLELEQVEMQYLSECKAHLWTKMEKLGEGFGYDVCNEVENFLERAKRSLESVLENKSPTLIVSHGGIHWAFCYLMQIDNHPWKIGNCELVHFRPVGEFGWKADVCR